MCLQRAFALFIGTVLAASCVVAPASRTLPTPRVTMSPTFNPANYATLGVYVENLSRQRIEDGDERGIEDEFMRSIMQRGYALAARSDIDRVVKEMKLQRSGITEEAIARVGRVLSVPAVVLVTINDLSTTKTEPPMIYNPKLRYYMTRVSISARMVMAERAEVLWISSYTHDFMSDSSRGSGRELWGNALQQVAQVVASGLPSR